MLEFKRFSASKSHCRQILALNCSQCHRDDHCKSDDDDVHKPKKNAMKHKKHDNNKKRKGAGSNPLKPHHGHKSKVVKSAVGPNKNRQDGGKQNSKSNQISKTIVPFKPTDSILLVGEGDFSFTNAIIENDLIASSAVLTTSTNESEDATYEKYPQTKEMIERIKSTGTALDNENGEEDEDDEADIEFDDNGDAIPKPKERKEAHRVFFNVDVTKKYPKGIKKHRYDAVIFNFPHTGGLTSDVDRQIRANQELLLSFLKNTVPLLTPEGCIVVTLFDGEPYVKWNLKELAKSVGLKSRVTFKFVAKIYKGYKHVRTIGNREREGDWKGEERGARTWVFEAVERRAKGGKGEKAKSKGDSSDDGD